MGSKYLLAIALVAAQYVTIAHGYRELNQDEIGELKTFPDHFTGQRLLVKDKIAGSVREPSFVAQREGFGKKVYMCLRLNRSGLSCIIKKNPQNEQTLVGLNTGSIVTVKGVLIKRRGRRLTRSKAADNYFFTVDELVEGWPASEAGKPNWGKGDYKTVSLKDLNLDTDKYLDQPLKLEARVNLAQGAATMMRCAEEVGISADDYIRLLVSHCGFIRFYLPKKDDYLKKIEGVSFGDVAEKQQRVVFLLQGELKKCSGEQGSGRIYYFIIRDLEKSADKK
jgi:hypothetical protein